MSALLGKAGKKLFEKHLEQYAPQDPLYEFYTDDTGKKRRRKRGLPPGLSARDEKILKSIKRRAHYLDKGFSILGFRFGWTFFIGLIPVIGDVADAGLNYLLVVRKARQADIPSWLLSHMLFNNAVSAGVGFVPVVGDLVLAMYKANSRNAALLEEFLRVRGEEYLRLQQGEPLVPSTTDGEDHTGGKGKKRINGVSGKDAEQIKPGAGIKTGEIIPTEPIVASTSAIAPDTKSSPGSSGKRSFFFSKSGGTAKPSPSGDRGSKFIEDVGST